MPANSMEPMCHEDVIAASNGEIQTMRKTLLAIAATGLLMTAAPVFAQDVGVSVGGSGAVSYTHLTLPTKRIV